ncbi:inner membrane protein [Paenibacillus sp. DS2015]|uniref:metal-dependent hydrolase n=1 Tax=Paenibacillus sp. DS2015 TaxID=3373917 RepID=UPI003D1F91C5
MKGTTHLGIGVAIGVAATFYYPFTIENAAIYVAVSGFSALSADLDGPSILSSRIGKFSKQLQTLLVWLSFILITFLTYMYLSRGAFYPEYSVVCVVSLLIGFMTKQGVIRNALVSIVGGCLIYGGWLLGMSGLIGLGIFVAWAPWLNHRGMTHTIWALFYWAAISLEMERNLHIEGIMAVATTGYLSHLLADTLTPQGVKWFYPFYKKSIKLPLR